VIHGSVEDDVGDRAVKTDLMDELDVRPTEVSAA
jgi:hypothetical protein